MRTTLDPTAYSKRGKPIVVPLTILSSGAMLLSLMSGCGSAQNTPEQSASSSNGADAFNLSARDRELYDVLYKLVEANNAADETAANKLVCSIVPRVSKSSLEAELAADGKGAIIAFRDVRFDSPVGASASVTIEMENDKTPKPGAQPLPPRPTSYYFVKEDDSWKVCSRPAI